MQLWVGLGNPGPQYAMHRHNVGFMAVDVIAETYSFGAVQKKFSGWVQEGRIGIGHPGHKDRVPPYGLGNYAKSEMDDLAANLGGIAAEAEWLARGEDARFMSELALRL